jgi:hypothetical protein
MKLKISNLKFPICDMRLALAFMVLSVATLGCLDGPQNPASTQPVTISDVATTQPEYWYAQPSPASAVYDSFATLFKTCENVCRDFGFKIDRVDYRTGILTTEPLESAQFFEPWRADVQRYRDSRNATVASIRRTARFEFKRNDDGTFEVSPKVLLEREANQERRITNVALYKGSYRAEDPRDLPSGTKETDEGFDYPPHYWYSVGRDPSLEIKLAKEVSKRLARKPGHELPSTAPSTQPAEGAPS